MSYNKTSTPTLVSALRILAGEIQSDDGVANMTIAEAADRIEELVEYYGGALALERNRAEQAEQRNAELEQSLKAEIEARNGWWDHCKAAEQRNAELETEHKRVHAILDEAGVSTGPTEGVSARVSGACAFVRKCLAESEQANTGRRENGRRADRAEQRNTELVAALREAYPLAIAWVAHWTSSPSYGNGVADLSQSEAITRIVAAIARAESATCQKATNTSKISSESAAPAQEPCGGRCGDPYCNLSTEGELMSTPAKHPDTELLDWLFCNTIIAGPDGHVIDCRDDAKAARKHGGAT